MTLGDLSTNFSRAEFACKCGCGFDAINLDLVTKLQILRNELGTSIKVHSGCRCPAHNQAQGGKPDSEHLTGEGADLECVGSAARYEMKKAIYSRRLFNRIGNGDSFIHVGVSKTLPNNVEWNY